MPARVGLQTQYVGAAVGAPAGAGAGAGVGAGVDAAVVVAFALAVVGCSGGRISHHERRGGTVQQPGVRRQLTAGVQRDPQGRVPHDAVTQVEPGVVGPPGARADEDRVVPGAQFVGVRPGLGRADPAGGAVGGGAAAVQGRGELPGDEGPSGAYGGEPHLQYGLGLGPEDPADDLDPGVGQPSRAAGRDPVRVRHRVQDAADPGLDQGLGAGPGAALVVAGFEGDHGGGPAVPPPRPPQRVDLRVRGARPPVDTGRDRRALRVEQHAADRGIRAGRPHLGPGQLQRPAHGGQFPRGDRGRLLAPAGPLRPRVHDRLVRAWPSGRPGCSH